MLEQMNDVPMRLSPQELLVILAIALMFVVVTALGKAPQPRKKKTMKDILRGNK